MGSSRNSYFTTAPDAAFMRMKEDPMRNGQLKPGYHMQIAVNSEYITGVDVFHDRTDFGTLILFMKQNVRTEMFFLMSGLQSQKRKNMRLKTHLSKICVA